MRQRITLSNLAGAMIALAAAACGRETRTVEGSWVVRYSTEQGVVEEPFDLSETRLAALVPSGDGYEEIVGEGFEDGSFVIEDVPLGTYFLIHGAKDERAVVGFQDDRDYLPLVRTELGRPDRVRPADPPTVGVELKGLSPWQQGDILLIASLDVGAAELIGTGTGAGDLAVEEGVTEIRGQSFVWDSYLIEAAKGDRSYAYQMSNRDLPVPYKAVNRAAELTGLDLSGDEAVISGTLGDVPLENSLHLSISADDLVEAARLPNPLVDSAWTTVLVEAQPRWRTIGEQCATVLLMYDEVFAEDGTQGPVDAALSYGDPFPSDWDRFLVLETHAIGLDFDVEHPDPGSSWGHVNRSMALDRVGQASIAPLVTAPQSLSIDGYDGFAGPRGVGETPELSWSSPAQGEPYKYEVAVYRSFEWVAESGVVWHDFETLVALDTTDTRFLIPEGLLESGNFYFAVITAWAGDELDHGSASVVTSLFEP